MQIDMHSQEFEQALQRWQAMAKRGFAELNDALDEQVVQLQLQQFCAMHPFLRDLFLCRCGRGSASVLHEEALLLAKYSYHMPLEQLTSEMDEVMEYFWALVNIQHAKQVIAQEPGSSATIVQKRHLQENLAQKQNFEVQITPLQAALVKQHANDHYTITRQYCAVSSPSTFRAELHKAAILEYAGRFWQPLFGENAAYKAGYALAKAGLLTDEMHLPAPLANIGFLGPSWDEGGITFRIEPRCFSCADPLLYFLAPTNWQGEKWELCKQLSNGLDNYCVGESIIETDPWSYTETKRMLTFRLNPGKAKRIFLNRGEVLSTEELGKHLLVYPFSRDFSYEFGEIVHGERIALARGNV